VGWSPCCAFFDVDCCSKWKSAGVDPALHALSISFEPFFQLYQKELDLSALAFSFDPCVSMSLMSHQVRFILHKNGIDSPSGPRLF
jgi:hypothetical protein